MTISVAIILGFIILAFTVNHAMSVRTKQYATEQEEWRRMERELYAVNVPDTKSPYVLRKFFHTKDKKWGYSIWDTRQEDWARSNGFFQIFYTMSQAIVAINQFEIVGGFDKTVLEVIETPPTVPKKEDEEKLEEEA